MKAKTKLIDQLTFSNECRAILLGTLLGDGSLKIQKGYKNARLSIKHSEIQAKYFYWKVGKLKEIANDKSVQLLKPTGFSKNNKLLFQSKSMEELTKLYNYIYVNNKIKIQRRWLNKLSPLSLMTWWLDDGSLISNHRRGVLCTDNFSYEELLVLVRYFRVVWGINVTIIKLTKTYNNVERCYYRLGLSTLELKKFLRIFLNLIPIPEMLYKVAIRYKDPILQQRWTSELISALPHFKEYIQKMI
jgi:hypothetical protein